MNISRPDINSDTLEEVIAKRDLHRLEKHGVTTTEEFFDCALCGLLDARIANMQQKEH